MDLKLPKIEEEILDFWKSNGIFKKTLDRTKNRPRFVFYEGPPFANGLPGIHHLLARAFKDIVLRYKTMQGFFVERKAGWDTHGLPTEISAEKSLGIKSKKEIEENMERFIEESKKNVFTYKKEWEEFTERMGYWLDLENAYITCSNDYIESLWWILKRIWDKSLLYEDYKVVPFCPRCGTSLSFHELAQGYKTTRENSVYVEFPLKREKTSLLIWTTTPWTLPGNVAVAVNPELIYVKAEKDDKAYIVAKERLGVLGEGFKTTKEMKGGELLSLEYDPPFKFHKPDKKAWFVVGADFVSFDEGTGLVHMAPAFGEEDMEAGKLNDLPVIVNVDEEGRFKAEVSPWKGVFVKDADPLIIEELKKKKLLFKEEMNEHEYPYCWRCGSPLIYYAKESWFIRMTEIKKDLIENNKKINWIPSYLKEGRFGEWLKEVKDWNLSRERYWGTPLPVWVCEKCSRRTCIGSLEELKEKSETRGDLKDLHRPYIDKVFLKCDCGGRMKRVKEVIDCWFDSGSMPFAQWHYPFENRELIDKGKFFPADYICEGVDQTRGWFYTLLAVSTFLGLGSSYKNVVSLGIVLDEKGQKMSKSKGNVVKPPEVLDKYGADAARLYFYTVNAVAESKNFSFNDVQNLYRKFFDTLFNIQNFFETYGEGLDAKDFSSDNFLDKWIVSSLEELNKKVVERLEEYDIVGAARLFEPFVDDLSNWYLRRSRKRFQKPDKKREEAVITLSYVLLKLSILLAPFTPFSSEYIYRKLKGKKESVHLEEYPAYKKELIDKKLEEDMIKVREIVNLGLKERTSLGFKVKQPLNSLEVPKVHLSEELLELAKEELNIRKIILGKEVRLDTEITPELKEEGLFREIIRNIQIMRKKAGLKPQDKILVIYSGSPEIENVLEKNKEYLVREVKIKDLLIGKEKDFDLEKEAKIDGKDLWLAIKKV